MALRILLSEGGSTSARQAVTALGLKGHAVEICDPDPHCLARFSRFVRRYHRCPPLGRDPEGFLAFIVNQTSSGRFDVLLPIHEQGFLFAKARARLSAHVGLALPSFDSYERALSKVLFSRLLSELGIPQPETRFVSTVGQLLATDRFPVAVKMAVGTASRGTWIVHDFADLERAVADLVRLRGFDDVVLVQDMVEGALEHAQAVFCEGRLVGMHAFRQTARGAGGGDATKESVDRPAVRSDLTRLGERLAWHGGLSVDYILSGMDGRALYIDCNPRLVEPMSAFLAGLDLADLLVQVSLGETPAPAVHSRVDVKTHLAIQALFGCALRGGSRSDLLRETCRLMGNRGAYSGSREELTPVRLDWPSLVPAAAAALLLLANPKAAHRLPQRAWGSHLLNPEAMRTIRERIE